MVEYQVCSHALSAITAAQLHHLARAEAYHRQDVKDHPVFFELRKGAKSSVRDCRIGDLTALSERNVLIDDGALHLLAINARLQLLPDNVANAGSVWPECPSQYVRCCASDPHTEMGASFGYAVN
jgi:hypothetical protein